MDPRNRDGNTPLHLAAYNGHESCVKALLYFAEQKGCLVDVNCRNNMGDTPLHFAAKWGYGSVVHILLQYGAQVRAANKLSQTALDIVHNDYLKTLLLATNNVESNPSPPLHFQSKTEADILGVRPKTSDQIKRTDLVLKSIENNDLPLMCYYLGIPMPQSSSSLDTKLTCHPLCTCDSCQKQFAGTAAPLASIECSEALNINTCNADGYSPLHVAAKCGRTDILRLLLDSGASVNVKTYKHQWTPLHLACKHPCRQVVREMLQCGGYDVDAQDAQGNTPLHYACLSNDSRTVELLLSYGSDWSIKNEEGKTPLQEAEGRALCSIVKLLKSKCGSGSYSGSLSDLFL